MASLTAAQFNGLDQRRTVDDLNTILKILRRDGELTLEDGAPEAEYNSDEEREDAEAVIDEEIANSLLLAEQQGPPPVTEAEAENTKEQAEAEAEQNASLATAPPVRVEEISSAQAPDLASEGVDDPKSNEDDGASEKQLPRTHSDLDTIAEERGHNWSGESLTVAEKQEELKNAGVAQGS